ncbi:RNA-directed DNA polymerase from mobile element jockey [Holothuria leucospilota]|uniref:RNA-directed DNA polymerase from mobile element jockey n=1 Tax=Holothuria leucospilota TaxID=206669 RepID=A0A9Q1HF97_HOLLE|nr:RNA-directed DNA polymerase from mobile element jockey [Holothuria leucospilota]
MASINSVIDENDRCNFNPVSSLDPENNVHISHQRPCSFTNPNDFYEVYKNYADARKYISFLHCNCRSLNKNFDSLSLLLGILNVKFDCVAVTETWLKEYSIEGLYQLNHYNFIHTSRTQGKGGGVGLYVKEGLQFQILQDLSIFHENVFESLFVEISRGNITTVVGVVYRPPSADINTFLVTMEELFSKIGKKITYILGDYNINTDEGHTSTAARAFENLVSSYGYTTLIDKPTRVTTDSLSLLDNIITNSDHDISSGVIIDDLSDHYPIFSFSRCSCTKFVPSTQQNNGSKRLITQSTMIDFTNSVSQIDWSDVLDCTDSDSAYNTFIDVFKKCYNNCFPFVTVKPSGAKKLWCTQGILNSCRTKNKLYRKCINHPTLENKAAYSRFRNKLTTVIRVAKFNFYQNEFDTKSIKGTWNAINTILRGCKAQGNSVNELVENGKKVSEPKEVCNTFNNYFVSVGHTLSSSIVNDSHSSYTDYLPPENDYVMYLHPTDENEIYNCIQNLKNVSPGHDNLHCKVIKSVGCFISVPLCHIINLSLRNGTIPTDLKLARVIPIYKSGDKFLKSNYRPISVLPVFSKILERIVYTRLLNFLEKHGIIYEHQYGFLPKKSTSHALINFANKIIDAFENNKLSCGIFLDLSKAFDTLDHNILMYKLHHYGIRGIAYHWFNDYLSNRSQYVNISTVNSHMCSITTGVPQGSILGPLLFLIYINDLPSVSSRLKFTLYADDTNISYEHTDIDLLLHYLNSEMIKVTNWFATNKLLLNAKKSIAILFRPYQKRINFVGNTAGILIQNNFVPFSDSANFLGVTIDPHLNWIPHTENLCKKLSKGSSIIFKLHNLLPIKILLTIYNSLILPLLSYCAIIWGNTADVHVNKLFVIQKRIFRAIDKKSPLEHTKPIFKKYNCLSLPDIIKHHISVFMFQSFHNLLPNSFINLFNHHGHPYDTRNSLDFVIPLCRLSISQRHIRYLGPLTWNALPGEIKKFSHPSYI